jgi:murein DD-endopeptidase MepM/ murein hydrolase activator NlpD
MPGPNLSPSPQGEEADAEVSPTPGLDAVAAATEAAEAEAARVQAQAAGKEAEIAGDAEQAQSGLEADGVLEGLDSDETDAGADEGADLDGLADGGEEALGADSKEVQAVKARIKEGGTIHDLGVNVGELFEALREWINKALGITSAAELMGLNEDNELNEGNDVDEEARGDGEIIPKKNWLWPNAQYFTLDNARGNFPVTCNPSDNRRPVEVSDGTTVRGAHYGLDIGVPIGVPIIITQRGAKVMYAQGSSVTIKYRDGTSIRYHHMDTLHVKAGQKVGKGETIGTTGDKGKASGEHLHFQARNSSGERLDPFDLLEGTGVQPLNADTYVTPNFATGSHSDDDGHDHS